MEVAHPRLSRPLPPAAGAGPGAVVGGILTAAGAVLERFAVVEAGRQSTRDPRFVVGPQRRRLQAAAGQAPAQAVVPPD